MATTIGAEKTEFTVQDMLGLADRSRVDFEKCSRGNHDTIH